MIFRVPQNSRNIGQKHEFLGSHGSRDRRRHCGYRCCPAVRCRAGHRVHRVDRPLPLVRFGFAYLSELQPALACALSERGDTAVIQVTTPIEHHFCDARSFCLLGEQFARRLGQ